MSTAPAGRMLQDFDDDRVVYGFKNADLFRRGRRRCAARRIIIEHRREPALDFFDAHAFAAA